LSRRTGNFLEQSSCKSKAGGGDCEESTEFLSIRRPRKSISLDILSGLVVQAGLPRAFHVQLLLLLPLQRLLHRLLPPSLFSVGQCA
jgi:hypothetical protein